MTSFQKLINHEKLKQVAYPFEKAYNFYQWCNSFADRRTESLPLMSSPFPTIIILLIYLSIVKYGPIYMKKRKAFELRFPLIVYNFGVTALNAWMAFELLECGLKRRYNFICQLVDTSDNEYEVRIAHTIWWYYFSKLIEFMDTFMFILRKKPNQLTFLHIYHHSSMFLFWYVGARFVPGGSALSAAMVNCFVHVIMYAYYGLAAFGKKVQQRFLWWKKYLTILQLIQFTIGLVLGLNAIFSGCKFTRWMQFVFVGYAFSFIILFGRFYKTAYSSDSKKTKTTIFLSSVDVNETFKQSTHHSKSRPQLDISRVAHHKKKHRKSE